MRGNYTQLTESIRNRNNPDNIIMNKAFSNELSTISYNEVLVFIRYAMKGVEPDYTRISKEAGENAQTHLSRKLMDATFRFQGSVMSNTHIKGYSDIDVLTIADKFYHWDRADVNRHLTEPSLRITLSGEEVTRLERETKKDPYSGVGIDDVRGLRVIGENVLSATYKICDVSKPKSIKLRNQDLNRDVDVVFANWYDNVKSIINNKGDFRGIQVYNKDEHQKENVDYPFLSIKRIKERGLNTNGRLLKMIRFLKSVKAESDHDIDLSSFDINAICFDVDTSIYQYASISDLVKVLYAQLYSINSQPSKTL